MIPSFPSHASLVASTIIATIFTVLTLAALAYCLLVFLAARSYIRGLRVKLPDFFPPVSILKPVKGLDPKMAAAFRSHCTQDYPADYEILFGVHGMDDPAVEVIEALQHEFPERTIRIVVCPERLGPNGKISNLAQMVPEARFDHLLVNDSDIRVSPQYLRRTMPVFALPDKSGRPVGMVTALYRGRPHRTLGSRLEALGISTDFMPGVLASRWLEGGMHFGLGSTLAATREALDAAGGFRALADRLADDYELGEGIHSAGYRVELSREMPETTVPAYRFSEFLAHQLRWARCMRDARPFGYIGLLFTFGIPWAVAALVARAASLDSIALLIAMLAIRMGVALTIGAGLLGDRTALRDLWLLPLRDALALGIWLWSFASHHIVWRGEEFSLQHGKLVRVETTPS